MCSASKSLYMYGTIDVPPGPRTRRAAEERRIRIPTPAERRPAYGRELQSKCKLQTRGVRSRKEKGREEMIVCWKKGGTPPYIGQGGGASSSPRPCGTKPKGGGGCTVQGGGLPLPWRQHRGENSPPPLMGRMGPYSLFHFFYIV